MHADGTGERVNSLSVRLQSEAMVRQLGVINLEFASASEHAEFLYARVRQPDGTVIETPVTDAIEQPEQVTREAPFYSDLKAKQLPVKSLQVGDTLEWKARILRTVAESPGQFWGQDNFVSEGVALDETVELHVPVTSQVRIWTNPSIAAPSDTTNGADRVVLWKHSNVVPTAGAAAAAAAELAKTKLRTSEQELDARKGALPSVAWTTFPSWEAVGAWYRGLEGDRDQPNDAVKAKVAELTAGKTTDLEKAQAVYDYVATQIRYIGVAFGVGRYQPHTAGEVLANQYGDCKDKHTLLAAMLTQLGLHPDAVLIGAGIRFNPALPSPGSFNHLITQVSFQGKPVWLDSTAEVSPWATLMPYLRDQQALVVPGTAVAAIEQTPALPPFNAFAKLTATETLDKDFTADAHIAMTFHDDDEAAVRAVLRQISPTQYTEFVQRFVAGMGYGGTATDPEISRPDDLEHPLVLAFRYKRVKEPDWGVNRITEPFMPMSLPSVDETQPPIATLDLGVPRTETSTVEIKLPEGWSAEVPEAVHAKAAFAAVDTTFHLSNGSIMAERTLTVLQSKVPATEWRSYKTWADEAGINSFPYIQLVRTSAKPAEKTATATPGEPGPGGRTAEQLVADATEQARAMDTSAATHLLDQAKAINAQQRGLWSAYAGVAYLLGEPSQAIDDLQKELALHPDEVQLNGMLAGLLHTRGQDDAALASVRAWAKATPDDPAAMIALMQMLHALKRDPEAISAGSTGLTSLSAAGADLTQMRLVLASLQAGAGKKGDAAATVLPLQKTVSDLGQQNSVVYLLADAGVDLPADESVERDVLSKLDTETGSWTLDESPATLMTQTNLLLACWDTLGWILFREGHLAEARPYIEAAARNTSQHDVLEHLEAVNAADHVAHRNGLEGTEQARRTFPLGPANGRHGTAELNLLLAKGQVVLAKPLTPPVIPGVEPVSSPNAAPALEAATDLVKRADLHSLFPPGSNAQLVRRGIVNCAGSSCQLVLEPISLR